jgi:hypothetical protein
MATRYHDNVPDGGKKAALEEAAKTGSLSNEKAFREKLAALQATLPSKPAPNGVIATPAEQQFQADIKTILTIEETTTDADLEALAKATKSALLYLAHRK